MKHLNIFFPEWQGYGEDNTVQIGAQALKNHLSQLDFAEIQVPSEEELPVANQIMGYNANIRHLRAAVDLLKKEAPASTFMVGGTCASEIAPVSYLNHKYKGDLGVLWFDAHGDLNSPDSSASKHFHGMPLRSLLGHGERSVVDAMFSQLSSSQVFVLGGRDFDQPEIDFIEETDITHLSPQQLSDVDATVEAIKVKGFKNLYVHVDLDVLEPADFPHMLLPVANGIMVDQLIALIAALKQHFNIVGSSIVEFVPKEEGGLAALDKIVALLPTRSF